MRLLQGVWKELVVPVDLEIKVFAVVVGTLLVQKLHQQPNRFFLNAAPTFEIDTEAVELVFAVPRAEPKHEAAFAQNIDKVHALVDPHRIGERQGHDRGADFDPLGQRRQVGSIDEHVPARRCRIRC